MIAISLSKTEALAVQRMCRNATLKDVMIAFVLNTRLEEAVKKLDKENNT